LNESRKSADKVDSKFLCAFVERFAVFNVGFCSACSGNERDWRYRNALVYDWNAEFLFNVLPDFYKISGFSHYFFIDFLVGSFCVRVRAVQKRNSHRNAAHIELLLHEHIHSFLNFNRCKKHISSKIGRFAASRRRAIRGSASAPFKNEKPKAR